MYEKSLLNTRILGVSLLLALCDVRDDKIVISGTQLWLKGQRSPAHLMFNSLLLMRGSQSGESGLKRRR